MKTPLAPHIAACAITAQLLITVFPVASAQTASADAMKSEAADTAQVTFSKLTYTRALVTQGKTVIINSYFLPKQTATNWTHKLSMYVYPGINNPEVYVNNMKTNLAKEGITTEIIPVKDPKIKGISFFEKNERMIKFNTFLYYPAKDGKILLGRHFTLRAKPDKEAPFRKLVAISKKLWAQELMAASFPPFKFPPKNINKVTPEAPVAKLHELKFVEEKVDDITGKGKLFKVDAEFATNKGSNHKIPAPFSVTLPVSDHVKIMGHPQVPETVRFTLTNDNKEYLESARFTSLSVATSAPMPARLQRVNSLLEEQMVPKFTKSYKDPKIVGRYKTKVGPYDAAVTVAQMTHEDGRKFFVKFVGILQEGKSDGIAVVLMLNGSAGDPGTLEERLRNGFAQQVMHSIRFAE